MGILDFFGGGPPLQRFAKTVRNQNAQSEERERAIEWLAQDASDLAIAALLGRFELTIDNHMKDTHEKQVAFDALLRLGPKVVGPVRGHLLRASNFAFPLQLVEQIAGPPEAVSILLDLLSKENDPFRPEKKKNLLVRLAELREERIEPAVIPLLEDLDEGVRYASVEVLLRQNETPAIRAALLDVLAGTKEESNRLRGRVAEAFHMRRWDLAARAAEVAQRAPVGWAVSGLYLSPTR